MKSTLILFVACVSLLASCATQCDSFTVSKGNVINFERPGYDTGRVPTVWSVHEINGVGSPAKWSIEEDLDAPAGPKVFRVVAGNPRNTHNFVLYDILEALDFEAEINVKPATGKEDQGGGLIFRATDPKNYYLLRWNPLEENLRLYYMKDGVRVQFGDSDAKPRTGWHRIGVRVVGTRIESYFDGELKMVCDHEGIRGRGKLGLWTKSDASSSFDDLRVRYLNPGS